MFSIPCSQARPGTFWILNTRGRSPLLSPMLQASYSTNAFRRQPLEPALDAIAAVGCARICASAGTEGVTPGRIPNGVFP